MKASSQMESFLCIAFIAYYVMCHLTASGTKVPVVAEHNKMIRLQIGDHLRLACPIHNTPSSIVNHNNLEDGVHKTSIDDEFGMVMYHWNVRDQLEYSLDSDPRYRFSDNRRVLEITVPLEASDSGNYTCTGITGFGQKQVTFEVHIRDTDENLLCATPTHLTSNEKAPCFIDPVLKMSPTITIEQPVGSSVKLKCEADGSEPIRYRWLMGKTVADWIATSKGTRGPILTIDHLKREHTGQYTCQVSNAIGSLNYTYRLIVTELPSAHPRIISSIQNHTFNTDDSAVFIAKVQCACDDPVIQWLKRIEPSDKFIHEVGVTKLALPDAHESEKDETFVILGTWSGSPGIVDETVSYSTAEYDRSLKMSASELAQYYPQPTQTRSEKEERIFVSRMHLQNPLSKKKHEGKYIIMTASLSDVKSMEYSVMFVNIVQAPEFVKGRRVLLYFLVPFCALFMFIGFISCVIVCRRRRRYGPGGRHSSSSINERCIIQPNNVINPPYHVMSNGKKIPSFNTSSRSSSNGQYTSKQANKPMSIQSPLLQAEYGRSSVTVANGFDRLSSAPDGRSFSNVGKANGVLPLTSLTQPISEVSLQTSNQLAYVSGVNGGTNYQLSQRNLPQPPTCVNTGMAVVNAGDNQVQPMNTYHTYFLSPSVPFNLSRPTNTEDSQTQSVTQTTQLTNLSPNSVQFQKPLSPSSMTEISFDQYSAVSQGQASSGTLTNHYTAPFSDRNRFIAVNGMESNGHFQQAYFKA